MAKIDKTTYEKIDALVREGRYPSIESFLELAVRNQLLLEGEEKQESGRSRSIQYASRSDGSLLAVPPERPNTTVAPVLKAGITGAPLWGQVNRLAPAKFVLRILLNRLVSSHDDAIDLKRFSAEVAEKATEFRLFAKKRDKKTRVRGEFLYVSFPKRDPFSQQRFLNYYVGKAPVQKWTDSILLGLSLANVFDAEDGSRVIGLTEEGLKFATLNSPLIDDFFLKGNQIDSPLSWEETLFLVNRIKSTRPGEYEFLTFILSSIRNEIDTPTKLKTKVFDFFKAKDLEIRLTEKVANTMLVGIIGRLVEMDLIKIEKDAQKSKYTLDKRAEEAVGKF